MRYPRRAVRSFSHSRRLAIASTTLAVAASFAPRLAHATIIDTGPAQDYCAAINRAMPGDEVHLAAGDYTRPCSITASGTAGSPIIVVGAGTPGALTSRFAYMGTSSNVTDIRAASFVTIRRIFFDGSADDVDAIKMHSARDITVEGCRFRNIGGISISANDGDHARIAVRDNTFEMLRATALYFGCHDGAACHATDLAIERNLIVGVTPRAGAVGYGLEIKLNSFGTVRDNSVYDTAGPGLMVYGSNRGDPASVIDGNYVEGSINEADIVVGGGPAIVRNNIVSRGMSGGISAQDYGGRGLQRDVVIVHNTVIDCAGNSIAVQNWMAGRNDVLAFNAIAPRAGGVAIRPAAPTATVMGNVDCSMMSGCFPGLSMALYDVRPGAMSPLHDTATPGSESWRPADDFFGTARDARPDIGAVEFTTMTVGAPLGGHTARPMRGTGSSGGDGGVRTDAGANDGGTAADSARGGDVAASGDSGTSGDAGADGGGSTMRAGCGCRVGDGRRERGAVEFGAFLVALAIALRRNGLRSPRHVGHIGRASTLVARVGRGDARTGRVRRECRPRVVGRTRG